jgi:putative tricarboxylic transport membrane protein
MTITRRAALSTALSIPLLATLGPVARAQAIRTLDVTVPGGPGSGLDQVARAIEDAVRHDRLAPAVRVSNVPGGGGMVAISQFVTSKRGNPQAVVVQGAGTVFFPLTSKTPVSLADVRPLARLAGEYEVIAVRADSPLRSFSDLIDRFKANPGSIAWGGGSPGSTENIFFARIAKIAGVELKRLNFIPHPNTGEVVVSALSGQVSLVGGGMQDFITQVEAGKMRLLAVAAPQRLPGLEAPTLREMGYDIIFANWRGVSVHPSITEEQAKGLAEFFAKLVQAPRWQQIMKDRGWLDLYMPEAEYQAFIKEETRQAREILGELGMAIG